MLSTILKSKIATQVSIRIMDAFVMMRKYISNNLLEQNYIKDMVIRHDEEIKIFANKLAKLRIFSDANGKMNLSVADVGGEILMVSQFTLAGDLSGGNRPSFFGAEEHRCLNRKQPELQKFIF